MPLFIIYINNRVKLNNPLMGTETRKPLYNIGILLMLFVKLNNPLMGTETIRLSVI